MSDLLWILMAMLFTWRLSLMITAERGPFNSMVKLRTFIYGIRGLAEGVDCLWCVSVWFGVLATVLLLIPFARWLLVPFALSGGSIILHGFFRDNGSGNEPPTD